VTDRTTLFLEARKPLLLSILRVVAALLLFEHGLQKIFNFPPAPAPQPYDLFTLTPGLSGLLELVGGALLLVGLFTRPVAFVLAGEMAAAYFIAHFPRSVFPALNGGDSAVLFCFVLLYLTAAGPGPLSIDAMRRATRPAAP
jgi:putative oxidoreductase